jgi:hypothetical protein
LKNRAREQEHAVIDESVPSDPLRRFSGVRARATPPAKDATSTPVLLISIGAPADPALLEPTYAYLSAYCFGCLAPRVAQRLNVAIYELYANALRYGSSLGEVRLEIWRRDEGAGLRISNYAEPGSIERLKKQVARVKRDAEAAFGEEMNLFASATRPPPMLGIVRVAHEAAMGLELGVEGSKVTVSTWCSG